MGINRRNFTASWLTFSVAFLVLGYVCFKTATQYAKAAPRERTTTASNVYIKRNYNRLRYYFYKRYSCGYNYRVDDISYYGHEDCKQLATLLEMSGKPVDSDTPLQGSNVVVYYDSTDPSLNSLQEFSAESEDYHRLAAFFLSIWLLTLVYQVVLAATETGKNQKIFVDTSGAVLDPEQIDWSLGSDGLFNKGKKADSSYSVNGEAVESDPSHRLRELYLDVVKHIHPDRALNEADRVVRERLMKDANLAFKRGDDELLKKILEEYKNPVPAS